MLCSTPELTALNAFQESSELCHNGGPNLLPGSGRGTPDGPAAAGFVDLRQHLIVGRHFLFIRM